MDAVVVSSNARTALAEPCCAIYQHLLGTTG